MKYLDVLSYLIIQTLLCIRHENNFNSILTFLEFFLNSNKWLEGECFTTLQVCCVIHELGNNKTHL
jgi:hypothetical protein